MLATFSFCKEEHSNFKFTFHLQRTVAETECITQASATTQECREGKRITSFLFYWLFSPTWEKQPSTLLNKQIRAIIAKKNPHKKY